MPAVIALPRRGHAQAAVKGNVLKACLGQPGAKLLPGMRPLGLALFQAVVCAVAPAHEQGQTQGNAGGFPVPPVAPDIGNAFIV